MNPSIMSAPAQAKALNRKTVLSVVVFLLVAIAGLTYVKWWPYYHKALSAAANHSIGGSIVSGKEAAAPDPSWEAAWTYTKAYFKSVWKAAVLGILLGSLVQVLIPKQWLMKALGRTSFGSTAAGAAASVPGMMCSCCAAPVAVGLRKSNVSVGAALAFWLGNPTLNPATLIFMAFVLGWKFTVLRLVFGILLVFGVSHFANRFADSSKTEELLARAQERAGGAEAEGPLWKRWIVSLWKLTVTLVPAYMIAVLVLGAFRAWLFPVVGESAGSGILAIVLLAIAGAVFVIPTAAEIPIVQTMMGFGLGAGPAAALSLTLPAVSLPSLLMISKSFPRRVLVFVTVSVIALGIASGLVGMWVL